MTNVRWATLSSACGAVTFASLLRRNRNTVKHGLNSELNQWENEGGSVTPSPGVTDTPVTG